MTNPSPETTDDSDMGSDYTSPDVLNAWVWIHVPKVDDLEKMYWEALIRLRRGEYTVYYQDPKTIDNRTRVLVMELQVLEHVDLENRSDEIEYQLREDIEGVLEVLEAQRGANGTYPLGDEWDDDEEEEEEGGDDDDEDDYESSGGGNYETSDDEPESMAQLRPRFSSPVPDEMDDSEDDTVVGSESEVTVVGSELDSDIAVGDETDDTVSEGDADTDSDVQPNRQLRRKKKKADLRSSSDPDTESEVDTDDILGVTSSEGE